MQIFMYNLSYMDTLAQLFGSAARVKIMRLFLFNPGTPFTVAAVAQKSGASKAAAKKECAVLAKAGMILPKSFFETAVQKKKGKLVEKRMRLKGFVLKDSFPYAAALEKLLGKSRALEGSVLLRDLAKIGALKLVITSGIFLDEPASRLDLLVVGDNLKRTILGNIIRVLEAEIGRELYYACFDTADFRYRLSMYDKLVRDVLDYPHQILLDKSFGFAPKK